MGYYVSIHESSASIPEERIEEACRALEPMFTPEAVKANGNGGSYGPEGKTEVWYSWVNTSTCIDLLAKNDLDGVLEHWGFYTYRSGGLLHINGYDSKSGQEELLLANLAPFITDGTHILWSGEDNVMWVDVFEGGVLEQKEVRISW